ncbi:hypothetical protein CR513_03986, partial [Mucuna pruriens]
MFFTCRSLSITFTNPKIITLSTKQSNSSLIILLVYVDDIILVELDPNITFGTETFQFLASKPVKLPMNPSQVKQIQVIAFLMPYNINVSLE